MKGFFFRHNHKNHSRTNSVKNNLRDIFLRQMRMSDPDVLFFICKSLHRKPKKALPNEIMDLVRAPENELSVNECESESEESEGSEESEESDASDDLDESDNSEDAEEDEFDIPNLSDVSSDEINSSESESDSDTLNE